MKTIKQLKDDRSRFSHDYNSDNDAMVRVWLDDEEIFSYEASSRLAFALRGAVQVLLDNTGSAVGSLSATLKDSMGDGSVEEQAANLKKYISDLAEWLDLWGIK